jgi:hypothetical protein
VASSLKRGGAVVMGVADAPAYTNGTYRPVLWHHRPLSALWERAVEGET